MQYTLRALGITSLLMGFGCQTTVETAPPFVPLPETVPETLHADAPPIVGGGLLVTADERFAVAADLDRDIIWIADLERLVERGRITLEPGAEPNRLAADGQGRVHVALRRAGALVTVDPYTPALVTRTAVCPAPRGVAYDPSDDTLYVACLHGELLGLDPVTHTERRRVTVAPDLRDVVVADGAVWVSTFRSAEVFAVGPDDTVAPVAAAVDAAMTSVDGLAPHAPRVAWRMAPAPDGARLLHQRHRSSALPMLAAPVMYYDSVGPSSGNGVVHATIAPVPRPSAASPEGRLNATLAVDLAVGRDGAVAVADPTARTDLMWPGGPRSEFYQAYHLVAGEGAVAVAWRGGDVVAFVREPAALRLTRPVRGEPIAYATLTLAADSRADTGHRLFHTAATTGITCASCHPEGGEDGHVWRFDEFGPRRTQSLRGGVSHRAPFHWSGDLPDFTAFMQEVFQNRMGGVGGSLPHPVQSTALSDWLDTVPHLPNAAFDPQTVTRGRAVFERIGCDECHFADGTVDPESHDVGTGEPLQVPSLIGADQRLPLMHDGCATTLADRFDPSCGGDEHGPIDALGEDELADLTTYLRAL